MQIQSTLKRTTNIAGPVATATSATTAKNAEAAAVPAGDSAQIGESEELSMGGKLKEWFFHVDRNVPEGEKIKSSPYHKLTYGAVLGALAYSAVDVATDIAGGGSPLAIAGKVAINGAALAGGYLAADVASGMMHHWADQYADPNSKNGAVRKFAKQSQRHHFFPGKLGNYGPAYWAHPLSLVSWAPLVAGTALGAPAPVMSAMIGLVAGTSHYGNFHNWAHMRESQVPAVGKALQKAGLAIGKREHGQHHGMPWNSDYCIVSGIMNKPMNAVEFWPKYEKLVHKLTGKEAEAWQQKDYRAYIDGDITREEYIGKMKEVRQDFRANHKERIREKWDIRG
jgi:palmitoyl-[glycerolipid] 3-(E)-desaturase